MALDRKPVALTGIPSKPLAKRQNAAILAASRDKNPPPVRLGDLEMRQDRSSRSRTIRAFPSQIADDIEDFDQDRDRATNGHATIAA